MSLENSSESRSHWIFALLLGIAGLLILLVFLNLKSRADDNTLTTAYSVVEAAPTVSAVGFCTTNTNHATGGVCAPGDYVTSITLLESNITGSIGGDVVYLTGTLSDANGFQDLNNMGSITYKFTSLSPATCTSHNDNDCIIASSLDTNCIVQTVGAMDTQATFSCEIPVPYNAKPGTWTANAIVDDGTAASDLQLSYGSNITVNATTALEVPGSISYNKTGGLAVGDVSDASQAVVYNTGNTVLDVKVHGTDMDCTTSGIANGTSINFSGQVKAALSDLTFATMTSLGETLGTAGEFDANIPVAGTSSTPSTDQIFTKLTVPSGVTGSCTGSMIFTAVAPL